MMSTPGLQLHSSNPTLNLYVLIKSSNQTLKSEWKVKRHSPSTSRSENQRLPESSRIRLRPMRMSGHWIYHCLSRKLGDTKSPSCRCQMYRIVNKLSTRPISSLLPWKSSSQPGSFRCRRLGIFALGIIWTSCSRVKHLGRSSKLSSSLGSDRADCQVPMAQEKTYRYLVRFEVLEVCRITWKFLYSLCCSQG
jgi:hypothetical protein